MPETKSFETVSANVAAVREKMREAAERAGRDPGDVTLVAATKVQTSDTIRNAIKAGITVCGENRVQELVAHLEDNAYEGARVHFIGHLQTNKVKFVVGKVDMIESIDSVHLMDAVDSRRPKWTWSRTSCWRSTSATRRARAARPRKRSSPWPGTPWTAPICGSAASCASPPPRPRTRKIENIFNKLRSFLLT